ncbi:hypothetical protein G9464_03500 [Halostella sp. JP-L12]|uniref:HalOD1 output domain-containing protein n=1 Tax=Halostella TaxID=1843185 RepID=UPI000EF7EEF4|nr:MULTISPECIES: HalOD1 output domain-containing protein [Halostella]NHN46661.1 hypothetical protein [Halostella sp. JP-L12]
MAVTETNATQLPRTDSDELCYRIVSAVAERRGVDADEIEDRLFDVVDVDALDRLLGGPASDAELEVSFTLAGVEVLVTADRTVLVTGVVE